MTYKKFRERLEEIQEAYAYYFEDDPQSLSPEDAEESLITLFEDYTKAIVGEYKDPSILIEPTGDPYQYTARQLLDNENAVRQTINQTSKTILRGESDE